MNFFFAIALLAQPQTISVFDSIGARRPAIRIPEIAPSWAPATLANRLVPDIGEGARSEKARALLRSWSATFRGGWKSDFAEFRRRWRRSANAWRCWVAAARARPTSSPKSVPAWCWRARPRCPAP